MRKTVQSLVRNFLFWYRHYLPPGGISILIVALWGIVIWFWATGRAEQMLLGVTMKLINLPAQIGFQLNDVRVVGRVQTSPDSIISALELQRGDNIFSINIHKVKQRLETLPWIGTASVERHLPDTLRLILVERKPAALWQRNKQYSLLDEEGNEIMVDIEPFRHLPVVVGNQVPRQIQFLLTLVHSQEALATRVRAAQLVSGRRWNLWLDNLDSGTEIRLPEDHPTEALQRLVLFDTKYNLLQKQLLMVDLRVPDRLIVRLEARGGGYHREQAYYQTTVNRSG